MKEVLVLRDLECIKAIAHPKRIDILKAFNNDHYQQSSYLKCLMNLMQK